MGWGKFVGQVENKAEWKGGEVIKVDPKNASQYITNIKIECPKVKIEVGVDDRYRME